MNTLDTMPPQKAAAHHAAFIPTPPSDQFKRAVKLHQQGDLAMAEFMYRQILREEPDYIEVAYLLGLLANQTGRPAEAIERINQYLLVKPDDAQAVSILGLCYFDLKDCANAVLMFERALEMNPGVVHTMQNLAKAQFQLEDYVAARETHESVLALLGQDVDAMIGIGLCNRELGDYEAALGMLEHAIVAEPRRAESHFFYGNVLRDVKDFQSAIDAYGTAITLNPSYLEAYANCASTLKDLGLITEAMAFYDSALMLDPTHAEANYNRALLLLNNLKLEEGWRLYERRLDSDTSVRKFLGGQRLRLAQEWYGYGQPESLIVIGEQGLGDQIFFTGMLPDLANQVPGATVCVEPRLVPLFKRSIPALNFISPDQLDGNQFDAQIYLGSLGKLYRKNTESLSTIQSSYLVADAARSAELRTKLKSPEKLICGISWLSKNADHGEGKSLSLEALNPVLQLAGFDFVNLQYGDTSEERDAFVQQHGVNIHHVDEVDNYDDLDGLAALIDACDIVVTVSNTTAHLAAALGKPVVVMLPNNDALFWYWHRDSHTTPWYPSARLFRRSDSGRWEDVIDAVALTLAGIQ
jgi:tetratricopeptide (TPR) repeat protein/ADP-heptose:LPS heptosyltransferase